MKRLALIIVAVVANLMAATAQITDYSVFEGKFNVLVMNDTGRNGYYDQKPMAELIGQMCEDGIDPEFVLATGDVHHFYGVASVNDPLWMTNYELIYSHPELMILWYPVLGNHEYRGNTQACIDYSQVSRRWEMPDRYYTKVFLDGDMSIRFLWVDTSPLIYKYRENTDLYPDACKQDDKRQLEWIDSVLTAATEDWVIVAGHHPIYAQTTKDIYERDDMQSRLDPILRKHHVDIYVNGHIHNFQHVRVEGSDIDYVTNSAASLSRSVSPIEGTLFCDPSTGFSVISATKDTLELHMIDTKGNIIHTVTRTK